MIYLITSKNDDLFIIPSNTFQQTAYDANFAQISLTQA